MIENKDILPPPDPFLLFKDWFHLASENEPSDPNAMSLATIGKDDMPSVRIVLMKEYDANGFVFYTNRESRKGKQLLKHPKAALCFHWKSLRRQIRIEGLITLTRDAASDAYHATRVRGSQIGAWASSQSRPLKDRADLEKLAESIEKKYQGQPVPRPPHWGGYVVSPLLIEFWQERPFRLHERILYQRASKDKAWTIERLYP